MGKDKQNEEQDKLENTKDEKEEDEDMTVFTAPIKNDSALDVDSPFDWFKKEREKDPDRMKRIFERVEKISPFIERKDK